MSDKEREKTIDIECPPGYPRPGDLIENVIAGTGLPKRVAKYSFFGHWHWDYSDTPEEVWDKAYLIVWERLKELYNKGIARAVAVSKPYKLIEKQKEEPKNDSNNPKNG